MRPKSPAQRAIASLLPHSWDSLFDCPANTFALHISVLYPFIFIIFSNQRKCYRQYCTWLLEKDQFTNSWFRPISIDHQLMWELSLERVSMQCCVQSANRESTNTSNCWILWFRVVIPSTVLNVDVHFYPSCPSFLEGKNNCATPSISRSPTQVGCSHSVPKASIFDRLWWLLLLVGLL